MFFLAYNDLSFAYAPVISIDVEQGTGLLGRSWLVALMDMSNEPPTGVSFSRGPTKTLRVALQVPNENVCENRIAFGSNAGCRVRKVVFADTKPRKESTIYNFYFLGKKNELGKQRGTISCFSLQPHEANR